MYTAGFNLPGCLPDSSEVFESLDDAFNWLQSEALDWADTIAVTDEEFSNTEKQILSWEKKAPCSYQVDSYIYFIS